MKNSGLIPNLVKAKIIYIIIFPAAFLFDVQTNKFAPSVEE